MIPKILILDNSTFITGAIRSIVSFARILSDRYSFEFAMKSNCEASTYVAEMGFVIHKIDFFELSKDWSSIKYPYQLYKNYRKLIDIININNISIIHVNDLYNQLGVLIKIFNSKYYVVYHVRLLSDSYLKPLYSIFVANLKFFVDNIICVSEAVFKSFIFCDKATLIYDSLIDSVNLPPKKYLVHSSIFTFIYIGNYVNGKGHNLALEAFDIVSKLNSNVILRFVGSGVNGELDPVFVKRLTDRAYELGLENRVIFDGRVTDIEKEMKSADAVINLSENESFSMVCLEALTFGLPLIASDCGGPREIIENEVSGLLVPNKNIYAAAFAMLRIVEDFDLCKRLSINGPLLVSQKFSIAIFSNKLADIYGQAVFVNAKNKV